MNYLYEYFFSSSLGMIELVASILTLVCVFQIARQSIWNFLWGSIGVILYGWIFYQVHLYADMTLQLFYFLPIQLYGWYFWYNSGGYTEEKDSLATSWLYLDERVLVALVLVLGTVVAWFGYSNFTDAHFPGWDSFILIASVIAQYLLSKKFIENWFLWIAVDLVAIPLYAVKGLYVTSGLYVILLTLCVYGLVSWIKSSKALA